MGAMLLQQLQQVQHPQSSNIMSMLAVRADDVNSAAYLVCVKKMNVQHGAVATIAIRD